MSWEAWGTPDDPRCEICGETPERCVCPECPTCGEIGNPQCYAEHGLQRSEEQIESADRNADPGPDDMGDSGDWSDIPF